jgi:hypothetical protein
MNHTVSSIRQQDDGSLATSSTTTMVIVLLIHVLFLHQWNSRKQRKDLLVSYSILVHKRQYYKLWLALLSHPPSSSSSSSSSSQTNNNNMMDWEQQQQQQQQQLPLEWRLPIRTLLGQAASWAYQSGFALLLYNSHLLWSCRALEGWYNYQQFQIIISLSPEVVGRPFQYARVLLALTTVALLVELRFSYILLQVCKRLGGPDAMTSSVMMIQLSSQEPTLAAPTSHNRMQQKIIRKPIGTLTGLTCALTAVFHYHFEYIPLQVLPFVDNRLLLLGFSVPVTLSLLLVFGVLGYLSYPSRTLGPIVCGLASGVLWCLGVTTFLQDVYWGSSLAMFLVFLCALSLRASDNPTREPILDTHHHHHRRHHRTWVPCVDFVSWNRRGEQVREEYWDPLSRHVPHSEDSSNDDSDDDDSDDEDSMDSSSRLEDSDNDNNSDDLELAPLLLSSEQQGSSHHHYQTVRARRGASSGS